MAAVEGVAARYVEEVGHHLDVWAVTHAGWSVELPSHCKAVLVAGGHENGWGEEEEDTRVLQGVVLDQVHDLEDALEHGLERGLECELEHELAGELAGELERELERELVCELVRELEREPVREPVPEPVPEEAAALDAPAHAVAMHNSSGLDGSQPAVSADCEGPGPTLV